VRACDYKFLASAGRTVSSTRPSTQICDSLNHPTQLPPPRLSHSSFKTIITRAAFVATHDAVMTYKQGHFFVTCLRVWGSKTNTSADT
jgi:hypothetical protein